MASVYKFCKTALRNCPGIESFTSCSEGGAHELQQPAKDRVMFFSKLNSLIYLGILLMTLPMPSYAYLDPGTGSLLLQGLIGAIGAAVATFGIYRKKIMDFVHKVFKREAEDSSKSN